MQRFNIARFGPNNGWASIYDSQKRCYYETINTTVLQAEEICKILNEIHEENTILRKKLARHYD